MKSKWVVLGLTLAGLAVAGGGLNAGWAEIAAAGNFTGSLASIPGGGRMLAADLAWLRMSLAWEGRDVSSTRRWLASTTTIDPAPLYFWINGTRILAYDVPEWRIAEAGGRDRVPVAAQERMVRDAALQALSRIETAMQSHPSSASLWIERAVIELNRLGDVRAAAISFRRAWEQPGAPYYAARLHAELLRRLGEKSAALAWLVRVHPQLPPQDESAGADLVLARIRQLERELGVEGESAYQAREARK